MWFRRRKRPDSSVARPLTGDYPVRQRQRQHEPPYPRADAATATATGNVASPSVAVHDALPRSPEGGVPAPVESDAVPDVSPASPDGNTSSPGGGESDSTESLTPAGTTAVMAAEVRAHSPGPASVAAPAPERPAAEAATPEPAASVAVSAPEPAPSDARRTDLPDPIAPFPMNLRGQATASDARADRLIRQIRAEVESLRQTLDEMTAAQEDMVAIDLDSVVADPAAAAGLPPAVLVRGLVTASEKIRTLNDEIATVNESIQRLQTLNHQLEVEHSFNRGRLETLDEVVAALHANLQDLRYERDQSRLILGANGGLQRGQLGTPPAAAVLEPHANG